MWSSITTVYQSKLGLNPRFLVSYDTATQLLDLRNIKVILLQTSYLEHKTSKNFDKSITYE